MKKPLFAIAALVTSVAVAGVPMTASAAQVEPIMSGKGYVIYGGQGMECLQQVLDQILANIGSNCPVIPGIQIPGTGTPELPDTEEPETDGPELPDTEEPGTGTPELPDTEEPGTDGPELPDTEEPGTDGPELPDTEEPGTGTPELPDTEEPGTETPAVHPYVTQILQLVNQERAKAGLSELQLDMGITAAANVRAVEIKQSFSHTRPNGSSFSTALKEQGVSYRGSGENIAWGQKSPEQVMSGWMNSDGHRANILNAHFKNIGIGYYQDQNGVNYWVQLFTY